MQTAPARMINRAQTVANTGLWIKKSTKRTLPFASTAGVPAQLHMLLSSGAVPFLSAQRLDWGAIHKKLCSRNDDLIPVLESAQNRILVAYRVAYLNRPLLGEKFATLVGCDEDKGLAAQPRDGHHRNHRNG